MYHDIQFEFGGLLDSVIVKAPITKLSTQDLERLVVAGIRELVNSNRLQPEERYQQFLSFLKEAAKGAPM